MQERLAEYLFQYRKLTLPGVGTLDILRTEASYDGAEQTISAPIPYIRFSEENVEAEEDIYDYLRVNTSTDRQSADAFFESFAGRIKDLSEGQQAGFGAAGYFTKENDKLVFADSKLPADMFPSVSAVRVHRIDRVHAITVGDKETTNAVMTEYFTETERIPRPRWWIAALILFLIGVAGFVMYTQSPRRNDNFGRETKASIDEPSTHQTIIPAGQ